MFILGIILITLNLLISSRQKTMNLGRELDYINPFLFLGRVICIIVSFF